MPDMIVQTARWCAQNEAFTMTVHGSSGDASYLVTYGTHIPGPYGANWNCTCPSFRFRKNCKHVRLAETRRCSYGWEAAAGAPSNMGESCPECGGPTKVMTYAV
jgi:hypothetical protein